VLQYADDTLIVLKADSAQVANLKLLLQQFSAMTGLHINYEKSTFVLIGLGSEEVDSLATLFGCTVASFTQKAHKVRSRDL
jgi:hypothetical protein